VSETGAHPQNCKCSMFFMGGEEPADLECSMKGTETNNNAIYIYTYV
jgi:hypothetical protein